MDERAPTEDEQAGIEWWNALTEQERAEWLQKAGSAVVADAWKAFKRDHPKYGYEVHPRPAKLGGGWRLQLLENGEEVGGGVFPPVDGIEDAKEAATEAYNDALEVGEDWLASRG